MAKASSSNKNRSIHSLVEQTALLIRAEVKEASSKRSWSKSPHQADLSLSNRVQQLAKWLRHQAPKKRQKKRRKHR